MKGLFKKDYYTIMFNCRFYLMMYVVLLVLNIFSSNNGGNFTNVIVYIIPSTLVISLLGFDEKSKTVLVGLPGHPAAAAMVFDTLIGDTLKKFEGNTFKPYVEAKLTRNLASAPGRSTLMPVILNDTEEGYEAVPVLGRSGNWSILVKAQGYFEISHLKEGVRKGETVKVTLFGY